MTKSNFLVPCPCATALQRKSTNNKIDCFICRLSHHANLVILSSAPTRPCLYQALPANDERCFLLSDLDWEEVIVSTILTMQLASFKSLALAMPCKCLPKVCEIFGSLLFGSGSLTFCIKDSTHQRASNLAKSAGFRGEPPFLDFTLSPSKTSCPLLSRLISQNSSSHAYA